MNWLGLIVYFPYLAFGVFGLLLGVCMLFEVVRNWQEGRKKNEVLSNSSNKVSK